MRNPLRSEAEAYRFLLVTVGFFAAVVAAKVVLGTWVGVGVAAVGLGAVGWWMVKAGPREGITKQVSHYDGAEDERHILVVANETVAGTALRELIGQRAEGVADQVLVVAPALNSPIKHWASDEGDARAAAQRRLDESLAMLAAAGVSARGEVGDADPLQAIEDGLRTFGADEIIISTHPEGRSTWLERGVVAKARERFAIPITHVIVDLDAETGDGSRG
jgi:hypothetical protein